MSNLTVAPPLEVALQACFGLCGDPRPSRNEEAVEGDVQDLGVEARLVAKVNALLRALPARAGAVGASQVLGILPVWPPARWGRV